jgi:hypothetical protein
LRPFAPGWISFALLALVPSLAFAQLGSVGYTTDGALVGRVCDDLDGDGACSGDEPGIAGARVVTEQGLIAVTDVQGRFHFAALEARAPDRLGGGRLLPGRHRIRVDARELFPGAVIVPDGATIEISMGAAETLNFAVRRPPASPTGITSAPSLAPRAQLEGAGLRLLLTGQVAAGSQVFVDGSPAEISPEGIWSVWLTLPDGSHDAQLMVHGADGRVALFAQRIEVVRRRQGALVFLGERRPLGLVMVPPGVASGAVVSIEAPAGTKVTIEGRSTTVGPSGTATLQVKSAVPTAIPLQWEVPGQPIQSGTLSVEGASTPLLVGLVDLEASFDFTHGAFNLFGRGAGLARAHLLGVDLAAELDFRDSDIEGIRQQGAPAIIGARNPDVFERSLDWLRTPQTFGDDSAIVASNAAGGRVRVELSRDGVGALGYGTTRASFSDAEIGRYQRALFGGYLDVRTPDDRFAQVRLKGFGAPNDGDPVTGLIRLPGHERFESTGGSLFYLSNFSVVQGSEYVRVEIRDGITGLPLEERHLLRGRDYTIDYLAGRILLTEPLALMVAPSMLGFEAPTAGSAPALIVDYEHTELGTTHGAAFGGELSGKIGPVTLGVGAVDEPSNGYSLLQARAFAPIGPVSISAEFARSAGFAEGLALSDDGGLGFERPATPTGTTNAIALTVRARGSGLFGKGFFDLSYRRRGAGYSDATHADLVDFQQISARVEQPFGPVVIAALFDDLTGGDPRFPFLAATLHRRTIGGGAGYESERWGVRLEARDAEVDNALEAGGRTSVGVSGRFRFTRWLSVVAGHKQRILERGMGVGAWDDSFSSAGVELEPSEQIKVGVRGGWGPVLGPQVWGHASWKDGEVTHYGGHSFDADAPSLGEAKTVVGARQSFGPSSAIFVEDVAAHDADALRLSRAVGLTQELGEGFAVSARYDRGLRSLLDARPSYERDAGGVTASLVKARFRLFARGEVRSDHGLLAPSDTEAQSRVQWVAAGGGELRLVEQVSAAARFQFSHTTVRNQLAARLLEGTVSVAWRPSWGAVIARYTLQRERSPQAAAGAVDKGLDLISVLPTVRIGSRFTLGAGAHAAWSVVEADRSLLLSASVRPAVRIIAGLEVAAEAAFRSKADDGGQLVALRGEVGWRFDQHFLLAAGVTAFGFTGLGLGDALPDRRDRVYLRVEAAY